MDKIILMLEEYLEKHSSHHIENNPKEEFNKIFVEIYENDISYKSLLNDVLLNIKVLIENRLFRKDRVFEFYGDNYSYKNKLKGVNELNEIAKAISQLDTRIVQNNTKFLLFYYYYILSLSLAGSYPEIMIKSLDEYVGVLNHFKESNGITNFFRGQANSNWNLIPSCLRNIDQTKTWVYTFEDLVDQYSSINAYDLYGKIIDSTKDEYQMVSFLQHAISFSPLIDFTLNFQVATYFALNNYIKINDFSNQDAAIFIIRDLKKTRELSSAELKDLKIGIYSNGKKTYKDYKEIYDKMGRLFGNDAQFSFSSKVTNDRMRYQQGTFILFNNYIVDNINTSIIHAKNGLFLTKIVIDKKIKKDIWEYLNKHEPEYKIKYLLNPYLIFNEI
ncbi:MAG: FRG domain-containing protein [Bacilli bacterium]|nr:FRG domain-containing protein [Bacilli bacterium]